MVDFHLTGAVLSENEILLEQMDQGSCTQRQLDWLTKESSIKNESIIKPWPIFFSRVHFDDGLFEFAEPGSEGETAMTIPLEGYDGIVDIAAWDPRSGKLATWLARRFAINEGWIFNPGTYAFDGCLWVHETPLQWLQADRDGIVIIDPNQAYSHLRHAPKLAFSNDDFAQKVHAWMAPPKIETQFLVQEKVAA